MRWQHRVRQVGNAVNLSTPLGLLVARIGRAAARPGPRGLVLAEGYRLRFPVAGAFTVGNVVITASTFEELNRRVPAVLEHEERHSWQWFACGGLPFLLPYTALMGWSVLRTGDRASAHPFERNAGLAAGGYRERPVIPLGVRARWATERLARIAAVAATPMSPSGGWGHNRHTAPTDAPKPRAPKRKAPTPGERR